MQTASNSFYALLLMLVFFIPCYASVPYVLEEAKVQKVETLSENTNDVQEKSFSIIHFYNAEFIGAHFVFDLFLNGTDFTQYKTLYNLTSQPIKILTRPPKEFRK